MAKKTFLSRLFWLGLALGLVLAACGRRPMTTPPPPTNTAVPTHTPRPTATATAAPTNTPTPSPTPDVVASFVAFADEFSGVTIKHPADWFASGFFGIVILASNQDLIASPDSLVDGGVVLVMPGDDADLNADDSIEDVIADMELGVDAELVRGPEAITVNGLSGTMGILHGVEEREGDEDVPMTALLAIFRGDDRSLLFIGVTRRESEATFLPIFEAMLRTVELAAPATGPIIPLPTAVGPVGGGALKYGETVAGQVGADGVIEWQFDGQANDLLALVATPSDSELDLVIDILDAAGRSIIGGEYDEAIGEEIIDEIYLPASGVYTVRVRGFAGAAGAFSMTLSPVDIPLPAGTDWLTWGQPVVTDVAAGNISSWAFYAREGELIDITVSPEEGDDVMVDVVDAGGDSILAAGEVDDSFDVEYLRLLVIEQSGLHVVRVRGYEATAASFELLASRVFDAATATVAIADRSLAANGADRYYFTAAAGDTVRIYVDPEPGHDVVVGVYRAGDDTWLDEVDDSTGFEELSYTATRAGDFYFHVAGFDGSTGTYEAAVLAPDTTAVWLTGEVRVYGRFDKRDILTYQVTGEDGENLTVTVESNDSDIYLELLDHDDFPLAAADEGFNREPETLNYRFTGDDPVTLNVGSLFGGGSFVMTLNVSR